MFVTNHVLSGAVTGALAGRPLPAFLAGVASHFVLDALPHWGNAGEEHFLRVAVADGLTGLAAMAALAVAARPGRRSAVIAGMAGAALPDLDKPIQLWFGRSPWPAQVDRFHKWIQDEAPDRLPMETMAASLFAVSALAALRGAAGKRDGGGTARGQRPLRRLSAAWMRFSDTGTRVPSV